MTCKYLKDELNILPPETGGSQTPEGYVSDVCKLNRNPGLSIGRCRNAPSEGPCWMWLEENTDTEDPEF